MKVYMIFIAAILSAFVAFIRRNTNVIKFTK